MMRHSRCGGFVYKDDVVPEFDFYELSCMMCGKRWYLKPESKFGQWITKHA